MKKGLFVLSHFDDIHQINQDFYVEIYIPTYFSFFLNYNLCLK